MHGIDRAALTEALRMTEAAIALDPDYAQALAVKARLLYRRMVQRHVPPDHPSVAEGVALARRAASLAPEDPDVLSLAGFVIALAGGDFATALELVDRALALNPNAADALVTSGLLASYRGDAARAIPHLERAARLNPIATETYILQHSHARLHFLVGDDRQALLWVEKSVRTMPGHLTSLALAIACLGGRSDEAKAAVGRMLAINPEESVTTQRRQYSRMFATPEMLDRLLEGLRKAGLPEG